MKKSLFTCACCSVEEKSDPHSDAKKRKNNAMENKADVSRATDDASCLSSSCSSSTDSDACHDHDDHQHGAQENSRELIILGASVVIYASILIFESWFRQILGNWSVWVAYGIPYVICGWPVLHTALRLALKGNVLNEFSLMGGATIAAIALGELPEAVGVMLFYRIGEYVQDLATAGSRRSVAGLLASKPTVANLLRDDGAIEAVKVEQVLPGQAVQVLAGEKIPLDGVVEQGNSQIDQSPLTGEPVPVSVMPGSSVLGGTINMTGVLIVKVSARFADTHMARILDMVENAALRKSPTERFITRFARYYTPLVFFTALLIAFIPPLVFTGETLADWGYKALVLLVVSCPCALLISVPLGYFGGIGAASKKGILVKGGNVFDSLLHVNTVVFDKTGTLTYGVFDVVAVLPSSGVSEEELVRAAVKVEQFSNHPVARSIMNYARKLWEQLTAKATQNRDNIVTEELPGKGIRVLYGGIAYMAGTAALFAEHGMQVVEPDHGGTIVHISEGSKYLGALLVSDTIREDAPAGIAALHAMNLHTFMLTGDRKEAALWVERETKIGGFWSDLLPEGKVQAMQSIADASHTAYVGDGINDAPILALSRVGIAMGEVGTEAAIEAADVVILNDSPLNVAELFSIAHRVRSIVWQNIIFALGVKTLIMVFGIIGLSGLWEAVFADVGVALLAVLNSTRVMRNTKS